MPTWAVITGETRKLLNDHLALTHHGTRMQLCPMHDSSYVSATVAFTDIPDT